MKKKYFLLFSFCLCIKMSFAQTGTHINFEGLNNQIIIGTSLNAIFDPLNTVTVEAWVKPSVNSGLGVIIGNYDNPSFNTQMQFLLRQDNNTFTFWVDDGTGFKSLTTPANSVTVNVWQHIAGVWNGSDMKIYKDGVLMATRTGITGSSFFATNNPIIIGNNSHTEVFKGDLDEIRIWTTALSAADIVRRKNCELAGNEAGLILYYKFNQGIAGGTNTSVTTANDASPSAINGVLTNFELTGTVSNWLNGSPVISGVIVPLAPTANAQSFCGGGTVANLVPTPSATIKWYNVESGGTVLPGSVALATATYYVAQVNANGCESNRTGVSVTINPTPSVNPVSNQLICSGNTSTAVAFTGAVPGSTYSWTNNNTSIGLPASGTGNIPSFIASNTGNNAVTALVTVTPTKPSFAYISNAGNTSTTVSIINTLTNTVSGTITVGTAPRGVSVSPDGSKVYIANWVSNTMSVINTATNTVTATIPLGTQPFGVCVSPDGSKVYATNYYGNSVSVLNAVTNTVTATITVGSAPQGLVLSPDGSKLYVTNVNSAEVSVINTATNTVSTSIATNAWQPQGICISLDGSKLYVATGSGNVKVISTATNTVTATIPAGIALGGICISPDGSKLYVADYANSANTVFVINTATNAISATITVGNNPAGISINSDGSRVYVANNFSNHVSVINTATNSVIATVPVGANPQAFGNFITPGPLCNTGNPITFTYTISPLSSAVIAAVNTIQTLPVSGITYFSNSCTDALIAKLVPDGVSPVNGNTTAKVWIEATQAPDYVKRHYEITPASGAATATAKVTIYFTQAEFNDFNALNTIKLPTNAADAAGIANLLIEKRSGVSSNGSGLPNTYTSSFVTLDPLDADITWNVTASRWEVSFDATGFSGFFVKTQTAILLPLTLLNFSASKQSNGNMLQWKTSSEINTSHFDVERSGKGSNFVKIATIHAAGTGSNNYAFTDALIFPMSGVDESVYYRLKMTDRDGRFIYSNIILIRSHGTDVVSIYPNPVTDFININIAGSQLLNTIARLIDTDGRVIKLIQIKTQNEQLFISNINAGVYVLMFDNGSSIKIVKN